MNPRELSKKIVWWLSIIALVSPVIVFILLTIVFGAAPEAMFPALLWTFIILPYLGIFASLVSLIGVIVNRKSAGSWVIFILSLIFLLLSYPYLVRNNLPTPGKSLSQTSVQYANAYVYEFSESVSPNLNWVYTLRVFERDPETQVESINAALSLDGFQTQATVIGSLVEYGDYQDFIYDYQLFGDTTDLQMKKGDVVLRLRRITPVGNAEDFGITWNNNYAITWMKLKPNRMRTGELVTKDPVFIWKGVEEQGGMNQSAIYKGVIN